VQNGPSTDLAECRLESDPKTSIGVATGAPEYQLFVVTGVIQLSDGRIAVANSGSAEVRFFDQNGSFLSAFGSRGDGPGEFRTLYEVWASPGDTLWVGNLHPFEFLVFAPSGEWVRTVRLDFPQSGGQPQATAVLDKGRTVLLYPGLSGTSLDFEPVDAAVTVFDSEGGAASRVGTFDYGVWGLVSPREPMHERDLARVPRYLDSFARMAARGDRIVVAEGGTPELAVYVARDQVELERKIRFEVRDQAVTRQDLSLAADRRRDFLEGIDREDVSRIPVAERVPALVDLRVGRDGRIWVREFPRLDMPNQSWLAFSPDGRLECRLSMPPFKYVFEFGSEDVLVHDEDQLGVERVFKYGFSTPQ